MSARLFVALDVAAEDRAALARWAREAVGADDGMRLVDPSLIHLTLAFLGHRPLDEIAPLAELVAGVAARPGALRTAGALWLSPRRPHVLTVAVEGVDGELEALHGELWGALESGFGLVPEKRRFRPHLTVARVRRGWPAPTRGLPPAPERSLTGEALVLYRSHLGERPVRYEAVERLTLR